MSPIYHLEIEARFCKVYGYLNDFPVYELNGKNPTIFSKPINSFLTRKNILKIAIEPSDLSSSSDYSVIGSIKKYESNDITGPDKGSVVSNFIYDNVPGGIISFENEEFDYSNILKVGKAIENEEIIKEYAFRLKSILSSKNTESILQEFTFKLNDYARAYSLPQEELHAQFTDYLDNYFYTNYPVLNFKNEEVFIRSWCDKRIWEIGVGPDFNEFMRTEQDEAGRIFVTRIFVGNVNNQIKVIR